MQEVFTQMDTCVTSIAFDPEGPNAFLATSADGRLCLYDKRVGGHASMVRNWHRHQGWIESVHWQSGGDKSIMTARCVQIIIFSSLSTVLIWGVVWMGRCGCGI